MRYLKIRPEYECSPLWFKVDNEVYENINVSQTSLSNYLKDKINKWANEYDLTLNQDYPPDSKFKTHKDEINFENDGFLIWELLKKEYSKEFDEISYYSVILEKNFVNIEDYQQEFKELEGK